MLELDDAERRKLRQFGAPPLTDAPIERASVGYPPLEALLSTNELDELLAPEGLVYHTNDVRVITAFVARLTQLCAALPAYWKQSGAWTETTEHSFD